MYRTSFRSLEDEREALLDALLPLLPTGVREGSETVTVISGAPLDRAALEAAAGRALEGWAVEEVPADWRHRRGEEGVLIGGRVCIRSPFDPAPAGDVIDVVVERRGSAFGSGSHPTTQMCVSLLLELSVEGGAADLGCGVGTLAIVASKLGWAPVVGVDRVPVAIEVGRENVARNGVDVSLAVADLAVDAVPLAPLLLVNAPPPVQERVVAALRDAAAAPPSPGRGADVRHVIVSGIVAEEVPAVVRAYQSVGFEVANALGTEDEWIALRLSC